MYGFSDHMFKFETKPSLYLLCFRLKAYITVLNMVFSINIAMISHSTELCCDCCGYKHLKGTLSDPLSIFCYVKNSCSRWSKSSFCYLYVCKSTIPCWLLCLAFLLSGFELPVMSACISSEAAASHAEMQEWYYHDTLVSGFSLGNMFCSTLLRLQHSPKYGKGVAPICYGTSAFKQLWARIADPAYLQSPVSVRDRTLDPWWK